MDHFSSMKRNEGTSLVAQWVRLRAPNAGGPGSIPGQGIRFRIHAKTRVRMLQLKKPAYRN